MYNTDRNNGKRLEYYLQCIDLEVKHNYSDVPIATLTKYCFCINAKKILP